MAAFIIRGLGDFNPVTPPQQRFNDVPASNVFYAFIDQMAVRGITLGCDAQGTMYCPGSLVQESKWRHSSCAPLDCRSHGNCDEAQGSVSVSRYKNQASNFTRCALLRR
jgi:hypothetical protein